MPDKVRCQSCGMPLQEGYYGKNSDGSDMKLYCYLCYQGGDFTEPGLARDEMIARSTTFMTNNLHYKREEAARMSKEIISQLKRWQKA